MASDQNKFLTTPDLTFRNLLCVLRVAEYGSVSRAAEEVTRSQSAVTKAINKVEHAIGVTLFDRSATGMRPTAAGEILANRIACAHEELQRAARFYRRQSELDIDASALPLFSFGSNKHALAHFASVYDLRDTRKAAAHCNVSLPTIQRSIRELESQLNFSLFERAPSGQLAPTLTASEIARSIKLAFTELGLGLDEIESSNGAILGHLRIGTLPFVRKEIIPNAIVRLLSMNHQISISTNEADYEAQLVALRSGDLDLIVGPAPPSKNDDELVAEVLANMSLRFVVRKGHPLTKKKGGASKLAMENLGWILPPSGSAHRASFDNFMEAHNLKIKGRIVETNLFNACRAIAENSDFAFLSRLQDTELGAFVAITPNFVSQDDAYLLGIDAHIVTRRRTTMSPALKLFIALLHESAQETLSPRSEC